MSPERWERKARSGREDRMPSRNGDLAWDNVCKQEGVVGLVIDQFTLAMHGDQTGRGAGGRETPGRLQPHPGQGGGWRGEWREVRKEVDWAGERQQEDHLLERLEAAGGPGAGSQRQGRKRLRRERDILLLLS